MSNASLDLERPLLAFRKRLDKCLDVTKGVFGREGGHSTYPRGRSNLDGVFIDTKISKSSGGGQVLHLNTDARLVESGTSGL